jgi:hypothetical protein
MKNSWKGKPATNMKDIWRGKPATNMKNMGWDTLTYLI